MFGKVFVSLPMTESLRRLNAQIKQRPRLKKTPEEEIKNIEIEEVELSPEVLPSNPQTNEISPSNEQNEADSDVIETEPAVIETEPAVIETEPAVTESRVPEPTVTEIKKAVTDEKTSNEIIKTDNNDLNLQKESSLQTVITNVVTTIVTVPNQNETGVTRDEDCHTRVTVSDEGDAKQDQLLSQKIDTSSAQIIREQVPKLKDEA
jgi:hypothetical protein